MSIGPVVLPLPCSPALLTSLLLASKDAPKNPSLPLPVRYLNLDLDHDLNLAFP
jgi:hypothetical protein